MNGIDRIGVLKGEGKSATTSYLMKLGLVAAGIVISLFANYFVSGALAADVFPAKDITFICGSNPGGGFDSFARLMTPFITKHIKAVSPGAEGGAVKVKNVTGGARAKATITMHDAKPDGYTIGDFNKADYYKFTYGSEKLPFDVADFTWLGSFSKNFRVVVSKKNGPKTFAAMVDLAKKQKTPLVLAVPSVGDTEHMDAIWFVETLGLPIKIVNTGGSTGTVSALVRGDADLGVMTLNAVKALIESGDVNPLATIAADRHFLPNVPTIKELGYPKCLDFMGGTARNVIAPPKMPSKIKEIMIATLKKVVDDPEFQAMCEKSGTDLDSTWDKEQEAEIRRYGDIILKNRALFTKYGL